MQTLNNNSKRKGTLAPDQDSCNTNKRWVRRRLLGSGEFGSVYMAVPTAPSSEMPSVMAVKTTLLSESEELVQESKLLEKFKNCPYIIDTYGNDVTKDLEGEDELFNVLLEYAQRGTLDDWIQRRKRSIGGLQESHVRRYTESILKGLSCMHGEGYVHCDIKPSNVLLVRQGNNNSAFNSYVAKICDLGLTKKADKDKPMKDSDVIGGTKLYFSPEILVSNNQEPPSDIWALGCTVLQALTGQDLWDVNRSCIGIRGVWISVPIIPEWLSNDAKDFLNKCFVVNSKMRWTAEMLLKHDFVRNTMPISTISRELLSRKRSVCQQPSKVSLVGGVV